MVDIMGQLSIWDYMQKEAPDTDVKIDGAVNLKARPISNYEVRLAYGDLTLIVAMIRDYIKGLDKMAEDGDLRINKITYEAYYRGKFLGIADRISEQIEYDYDEALKRCLKKQAKEDKSDIGEEAMALAVKRGIRKEEKPKPAEQEVELDEREKEASAPMV